eukprot:5337855-Ditylum_brightwellii.AAC.1
MKEELKLLIKAMSNRDQFKWETPIAHLVPRTPDFTADGDLSLDAAGAFLVAIGNLKKNRLLQHEHPVVLIRADNMSD